jgi:hypothetical protein
VRVWAGVDASVKRDSTGIAAVTWDREAKKVRLVHHRIFQPSPDAPIDFETMIEDAILDLKHATACAKSAMTRSKWRPLPNGFSVGACAWSSSHRARLT